MKQLLGCLWVLFFFASIGFAQERSGMKLDDVTAENLQDLVGGDNVEMVSAKEGSTYYVYALWKDTRKGVGGSKVGWDTKYLYFNRSMDGGVTWGTEYALNTTLPLLEMEDYQIVASETGQYIHVLWTNSKGYEAGIYVVTSSDYGASFSAEKKIAGDGLTENDTEGSAICTSNDGRYVYVSWTVSPRYRAKNQQSYFSYNYNYGNPNEWSSPEKIAAGPNIRDGGGALGCSGDGNYCHFVFFDEREPGPEFGAYIRTWNRAARGWEQNEIKIEANIDRLYNVVCKRNDGKAHIIWSDGEGKLCHNAYSYVSRRGWTVGVQNTIANGGVDCDEDEISFYYYGATDFCALMFPARIQSEPDNRIYTASWDGSSWGAPVRIEIDGSPSSYNVQAPSICGFEDKKLWCVFEYQDTSSRKEKSPVRKRSGGKWSRTSKENLRGENEIRKSLWTQESGTWVNAIKANKKSSWCRYPKASTPDGVKLFASWSGSFNGPNRPYLVDPLEDPIPDETCILTELEAPAVATAPAMTTNPTTGDIYVAWIDDKPWNGTILFRRYDNTNSIWEAPVRLSPEENHNIQTPPVIHYDGSDVYVAWHGWTNNGNKIVVSHSADCESWTREETVSVGWIDYDFPRQKPFLFGTMSALRQTNTPCLVWGSDEKIYFAHKGDNWGSSFTLSVDPDCEAEDPSLFVNENQVYVVWTEGDDDEGGYKLYFRKGTFDGSSVTWESAQDIGQAGTDSRQPSLAFAGGNIYVIWTRFADADAPQTYTTSDIVFRKSSDGGTTWSTTKTIDNDGGQTAWSVFPQILAGGTNVGVTWLNVQSDQKHVYFNYSTDSGDNFQGTNGHVCDNNGCTAVDRIFHQMALGQNEFSVVWMQDNGGKWEIYGNTNDLSRKKIRRNTRAWGTPKQLNNNAAHAIVPQVVFGSGTGPNNGYAVWADQRSGTWNVYYRNTGDDVSKPTTLTCPATGKVGVEIECSTGGSSCTTHGTNVEYQFDWGDGTSSNWGGTTHTYTTAGTYGVRSLARCVIDKSVLSEYSDPAQIVVSDSVSIPTQLTGPNTGNVGQELSPYAGSGSSCTNPAHQVEYQFKWGDGNDSEWIAAFSTTSHTYTTAGTYDIKVRARCATDTAIMSDYFDPGWDVVISDVVSKPNVPTGPTTGNAGNELTYSASGSSCTNPEHQVKYQFNWGDGTGPSEWVDSSAVHTYASGGNYNVTVKAHCATDPEIESATSDPLAVAIANVVSKPSVPTGPDTGNVSQSLEYTPGGSSCTGSGHTVEYQFTWGDGSPASSWVIGSIAHSYTIPDTYSITVKARCSTETEIESVLSDAKIVKIDHTVTQPTAPSGPTTGKSYQSLSYTTGGSSCANPGHSVQYRFNWGDGSFSDWGNGSDSHVYLASGDYQITAQARCSSDNTILSTNSSGSTVTIADGVSSPSTPTGPNTGDINESIRFETTIGEGCGSPGHGTQYLQYQFTSLDAARKRETSDWSADKFASFRYTSGGDYNITAKARCTEHTTPVESESSEAKTITIQEFVDNPLTPSGPASVDVNENNKYTTSIGTGCSAHGKNSLEYRFNWGNRRSGTRSITNWSPAASATISYNAEGIYDISAQSRCTHADHGTVKLASNWSLPKSVSVFAFQDKPTFLGGPETGDVNELLTYTAGTAGCSAHGTSSLQYQFTWEDRKTGKRFVREWGSNSGTHTYTQAGTYNVTVQARCTRSEHGTYPLYSDISDPKIVTIAAVEKPTKPNGPASGDINENLTFTTSVTNGCSAHGTSNMQYNFNWGDGESGWGGFSASHTYATAGTYDITVKARCTHADHGDPLESETSDICAVPIYAIQGTPGTPSGPISGKANQSLTYTTTAPTPGCTGHGTASMQYRFVYPDRSGRAFTAWSSSLDAKIAFSSPGTYNVKAQAQCAHPSHGDPLAAQESASLDNIVITDGVSKPTTPSGPGSANVNVQLTYTTGGSACTSHGTDVQYQFEWGNGQQTDWITPTRNTVSANVTYATAGTYNVKSRARCAQDLIVSDDSDIQTVTISNVVGRPNAPSGQDAGTVNESLIYTASGSSCSDPSHTVEYQFTWGDRKSGKRVTSRGWVPASDAHTYLAGGNYDITVQARCAQEPTIVSAVSPVKAVTIYSGHTVTTPTSPTGPESGDVNQSLTFTVQGSNCNQGHEVEYQFDWGDGSSNWVVSNSGSHAYGARGYYDIKCRARCKVSPGVLSGWSGVRTVHIFTWDMDFDGDGKSDIAIWNKSSGDWKYIKSGSNTEGSKVWISGGNTYYTIIPGDYDGDKKTDFAVWKKSNGVWNYARSSDGQTVSLPFGDGGSSSWIPVPGDYDGDRKTDLAVWHKTTGEWRYRKSLDGSTHSFSMGETSPGVKYWIPVPGDYDGDGRTDFCVWNRQSGNWYAKNADNQTIHNNVPWGSNGAAYWIPVPGDYDGDLKADLAVFNKSSGVWEVQKSNGGSISIRWKKDGSASWIAVPADYDGDGKTDLAVWEKNSGKWWCLKSSEGNDLTKYLYKQYLYPGLSTYLPIPQMQHVYTALEY